MAKFNFGITGENILVFLLAVLQLVGGPEVHCLYLP